jgi:hypothetical protein
MIKKKLFFGLVLFMCMAVIPGFSFAQPPSEKDAQSLLSAFMSYTDLRIGSVQKSLEVLASTKEARSGKWENMKDLLGGYQRSDEGLIMWYASLDGTYYTVDKGLIDEKLSERRYFPDLIASREVTGALVISKSTGQRSAVIAVPVKDKGKVIGAVGASLFLDKLSEQVASVLDLRADVSFFALAPDGLTTLHKKTERHFLDPREMGSETLKKAVNEMLSIDSGEVTYEFDNATKNAIYRTSTLTQWKFVIIFSAVPQK